MTSDQTNANAEPSSLHGTAFRPRSVEDAVAAIEKAFDYRGDVTLLLADGSRMDGYIFDRRRQADPPVLRMLTETGERCTVRYAQNTLVHSSGKDTAAGRSWETWVKRYYEKKMRGEAANIHPESLDE